jgi:hypothetical protein
MMTVLLTCPNCGSGVHVYPKAQATQATCNVCEHQIALHFQAEHEQSTLHQCGVCERKDFYVQKDFNRKIGVILFVIAACLVPWTYGLSLLVLYLADVFLFRKLPLIVICYKCKTIYKNVVNVENFKEYDHEMNDRIVYSDHDFQGKSLH